MNCDCKKDIESKLTDRFKEQSPAATDHSVTLEGYGLTTSGNTMKVMGCMPVKQSANFTSKSGVPKLRTTSISMLFSFCPFCGVKV